jgi:hypothetical protein
VLFGDWLSVEVSTFAERVESLKAGILGAAGFTLAYGFVTLAYRWILGDSSPTLELLEVHFWGKIAIAPLSGFLFGVTYRYIIRSDTNAHLKDGAVLAFGLVRSLAAPELSDNLVILSLLGVESVVCFAIARWLVDFAFTSGWLKPFV